MRDLSEILKSRTQHKTSNYSMDFQSLFVKYLSQQVLQKFTGNSVGFMPVASENPQVNLSPGGNHIDSFSVANGEITAIRNELILRK